MSMASPIVFHTQHRPRFSELDPYGHMNTQHYVAYFLEHRFAGLRQQLGLGFVEIGTLPCAMVVKSLSTRFRRPVCGDQEFHIHSQVASYSEREATIDGQMLGPDGVTHATFSLILCCVDKKCGAPTPWPEGLLARFYQRGAP